MWEKMKLDNEMQLLSSFTF